MTTCEVCGTKVRRRPWHGRMTWRHVRPSPNGPHDHPAKPKEGTR